MIARKLEVFMVTAQAGSFQKASERLFISSTALIKQINSLEESTGLVLFHRTNRGIYLTESGKIFQAAAADILQRYFDALKSAQQTQLQLRNPIRLGISLINPFHRGADSLYYTPDCFSRFSTYIYPISCEYKDFIDEVRNIGTRVDIIPYFFGNEGFSAYCQSFCLAKLPLRVAVPIMHPLANKARLTYQDLNDQEIVTLDDGSNSLYARFNEDIRKNAPRAQLRPVSFLDFGVLNHAVNYRQLVLVGNYLKDAHPLLKLIPVDWPHLLPYGLLYSKKPAPGVEALIQSYRDMGLSGEPEDAPIIDL